MNFFEAVGYILKNYWKSFAYGVYYTIIISLISMKVGVVDIINVYNRIEQNIERIVLQKESGLDHIVIPNISADTRFCGLYQLKYIGVDTYDTWPNLSMARYYGVKTIKGE